MVDSSERESQHELYREVVETHQHAVEVIDGELRTDAFDYVTVNQEKKMTVECSCGERFRKDSTAIEHLNKYNDE